MKRFACSLFAIALFSGWFFAGDFFQHGIIAFGFSILTPTAFGVLFITSLYAIWGKFKNKDLYNPFFYSLKMSVILFLSLFISLISGENFHKYFIYRIDKYVEQALPLLDDYYKTHGQYPSSLDELKISFKPHILNYSSDGKDFSFYYEDGMAGMSLSAKSRTWRWTD